MLEMNKEEFLKTEFGSTLKECITAWDHWLNLKNSDSSQTEKSTGQRENVLISVRRNGKHSIWRSNSSTVSAITSTGQMNILAYLQKMKPIGCLR